MKYVYFVLIAIAVAVLVSYYPQAIAQTVRVFTSAQVGTNPVDGYCLTTNGATSTWAPCGASGGSKWTDTGSFINPTNGESIYVTGSSTLIELVTNTIRASSSAGLIFRSNNGTQVADFGAGGGSNATFNGGLNVDGATRLATSLTGILRADSGSVATQATGTLTETVSGLQFDATRDLIGGSAVLSLSSGFTIPLTASTTEWATAYASTTNLTPAYIRSLFSASSPITYNSGTGAFTFSTAGDWTGTFDGQEGSYYLNASNLNAGTINTARVAGSYTGITGLATTTIASTTITRLTVTGSTSLPSLTASRLVVTDASSALSNTITSTNLRSSVTDGTGTGALTFATAPTFTTRITTPEVTGGTAVSSVLTFRTTTGAGTSDRMSFLVGNNGNHEAMRIHNSGTISIGSTTAATTSVLSVVGTSTTPIFTVFTSGASKLIEMLNTGVTTLLGTWDMSGATVKQDTYKSFTWPGVATTTSATTTVALGTAYTTEQWTSMDCFTSSGSGAVIFTDGTNRMNGVTATTTVSRTTLSTNNTFTALERRYVEIGPLTAATVSCTVEVVVNN